MVYQGKQFKPDLEPGSEGARRPTSAPRITTPLEVDLGRKGTRKQVANALSREAGHNDQDEHGAPTPAGQAEASPPEGFFQTVKQYAKGAGEWSIEKGTEIQAAWREYRQVRKAYQKGEHTKEQIQEATEAILRLLGVDGALAVMAWPLSKLASWYLEARDHELHKTNPDYANLAAQFMDLHEDDDHPGSYHHGVEALCAGMDERALRRTHYNAFSSVSKFRHYYGTPDGRKKIKEQLAKLLGPEVDEPHELTEAVETIASRCHIEITGTPPAATLHAHDLQHRHANHSLHALTGILAVVYNEITPARLTKIMGPNEDVKLEDDLAKFGENLRKKVKGNPDIASQLLGKIEVTDFNQFFHTLRNDTDLENSIEDEPALVKEQIQQLFNFSSKENISDADLLTVRNAMVGARTGTPPAVHFTGGFLGTPPTDATELAKYDGICEAIYQMSTRLLAPRTGAPGGSPSRLSQLYPERADTIKYEEFGAQLGKIARKSGPGLDRARASFLRGWERGEFANHFIGLLDGPTLTAMAGGSKEEKAEAKLRIAELTGLKAKKITGTLFSSRMAELIATVRGTVPASLASKQTELLTSLRTINTQVSAQLDSLYLDVNLEENLGAALQSATDATTASAILDRIGTPFLYANYPQVMQTEAVISTASLINKQKFKNQLAAFIGAPKAFVWNDTSFAALVDGLEQKMNDANTVRTPTHPGSTALTPFIANLRTFTSPFISSMNGI